MENWTGFWDHHSLPDNVRVGASCYLERKDSFDKFRSKQSPGLVLGDNVEVYSWCTFNVEPSGMVEVGDDSVLVGAVFMCADRITIGRRVQISYNVTLADSDFHPQDPEARRQDAMAIAPEGDPTRRPLFRTAPVVIEDDVRIGVGAMILKGVRIGRGACIEPGTVVAADVPPGAVVEGNPGRVRVVAGFES